MTTGATEVLEAWPDVLGAPVITETLLHGVRRVLVTGRRGRCLSRSGASLGDLAIAQGQATGDGDGLQHPAVVGDEQERSGVLGQRGL
jgi:hypothetical protein